MGRLVNFILCQCHVLYNVLPNHLKASCHVLGLLHRQKCKIFLLPASGCVVPFWNLRTTSESEESNMEITHKNKIPIAFNTDAVDDGDELVLFRPKNVKLPKPLELVATAKKKARTS